MSFVMGQLLPTAPSHPSPSDVSSLSPLPDTEENTEVGCDKPESVAEEGVELGYDEGGDFMGLVGDEEEGWLGREDTPAVEGTVGVVEEDGEGLGSGDDEGEEKGMEESGDEASAGEVEAGDEVFEAGPCE